VKKLTLASAAAIPKASSCGACWAEIEPISTIVSR
jgi:hypothetical protein